MCKGNPERETADLRVRAQINYFVLVAKNRSPGARRHQYQRLMSYPLAVLCTRESCELLGPGTRSELADDLRRLPARATREEWVKKNREKSWKIIFVSEMYRKLENSLIRIRSV